MSVSWPKILLFIYLFAALTPQQLKTSFAKLPFLIQHFQKHQQEQSTASLAEFIFEHYGEGFAKHSTEHNHSQLPGKGEHSSSQTFETLKAFLTSLPSTPFQLVSSFRSPKVGFMQTSTLLPSAHLSSIWQPPKA